MPYGDPIVKVMAASNGFVVEIFDPPKSKPKDGYVPYEERYKSYVADSVVDVMELLSNNLEKAAKKADPKAEFESAFKEATEQRMGAE